MGSVVRINGLVRIAQHVRAEIGSGLTEGEKARLKETADGALGRVNEILKARAAKLSQLAAPSRRAYQYLAAIDWGKVKSESSSGQTRGAGKIAPKQKSRVRWAGLGGQLTRFAERLSSAKSSLEVEEIRLAIVRMSNRLEASIVRGGHLAENLSAQAREQRGWFAWMATESNFGRYLAALKTARGVLADGRREPMVLSFVPSRFIYRARSVSGRRHVSMPTPMVCFDQTAFGRLAELIFGRTRASKSLVIQRMLEPDYVALMNEIESLGGVVRKVRGAYHDLDDSFDRVNARYFGGTMARPRLGWSQNFTRRRFGHYRSVTDSVMLTSTMDRADVPDFVVDFIMYHELLHKKHGTRWVKGRGYAHTTAFYADERKFEQYEEAEAWINRLARGG